MGVNFNHKWDLPPQEAMALQNRLATKVSLTDSDKTVQFVAGIDVGFPEHGRITKAAICVFSWPDLGLVESQTASRNTSYPYIPGLLSFREMPAILDAFYKLTTRPDLCLCDGQGIAHPRGFGIACHFGLLTNIPSIGVGKSKLVGRHNKVPNKKGSWEKLVYKNKIVGAALRTRESVKSLYVSPGHLISLESSIIWVMRLLTRYKLPEPIRAADKLCANAEFSKTIV